MLTLALSEAEAQVIREVLTSYHNTLLLELSHAERMKFKDMLRAREAVVTNVLERIVAVPA